MEENEGPNLTPLLDVVLNIMMFFMITSNFVALDQINKSITLPVAQSAVPVDDAAHGWVFLNMDKEGKIVNSQGEFGLDSPGKIRLLLEEQKKHIERTARIKGIDNPDIVVVLRADRDVEYKDVWQVLKQCVDLGYKKWQLRVLTK